MARKGKKRIGFISQDVESVFPSLIVEHTVGVSKEVYEASYADIFSEDECAFNYLDDEFERDKEGKIKKDEHNNSVKNANYNPNVDVPIRSIKQNAFVPILVKGLQEEDAKVEALKLRVTELEAEVELLKAA